MIKWEVAGSGWFCDSLLGRNPVLVENHEGTLFISEAGLSV